MRILITGGAGFIGGHIANTLSGSGHEVGIIDDLSSGVRSNVPENAEFAEFSITDAAQVQTFVQKFQPDAICHQAAQLSVSRSVREPDVDAQINVLGLLNVLQAAKENNVNKFVFASSGGVLYGDVAEPAPETTAADPISPYGISKWAGERYLQFFANEFGMQTVALRYSNVFGPRQNPHGEAGVVAIFCEKMLAGEAATINGDGKYVRDYVYVMDVVDANVRALAADSQGFTAYNVGTSRSTDVNELATMLREHCQSELDSRNQDTKIPESQYGPARAGDLRSSIISYEKIQTELDWKPQTDVQNGLKATAAWFAQNKFDL